MLLQSQINWTYFGTTCGTSIVLIVLIAFYYTNLNNFTTPILQIVAFLLINLLLEAAFQAIGFITANNNALCSISIIGRTAFLIAANFWVICITRLLYLEKLAPGKQLNLFTFLSRNIILTYLPSLIVSGFLTVVILINNSQSEQACWTTPTNKQFLDYVIYMTCFVLPNLIACVILITIMVLYYKLPYKPNIFIGFPYISIIFGLYYIGLKLYQFFQEIESPNYYEMPVIIESVVISVLFMIVCWKSYNKKINQDDVTLNNSSIKDSFTSV